MEGFIIENGVLTGYTGQDEGLIVPEGVTRIGAGAFRGRRGLRRLELPEGVTSIGDGALDGCEDLEELVLPEGLVSIGEAALRGCSGLTELRLPDSLRELGASALEVCYRIRSLIIPRGLITIGDGQRLAYMYAGTTVLCGAEQPDIGSKVGKQRLCAARLRNLSGVREVFVYVRSREGRLTLPKEVEWIETEPLLPWAAEPWYIGVGKHRMEKELIVENDALMIRLLSEVPGLIDAVIEGARTRLVEEPGLSSFTPTLPELAFAQVLAWLQRKGRFETVAFLLELRHRRFLNGFEDTSEL